MTIDCTTEIFLISMQQLSPTFGLVSFNLPPGYA